MEGQRTSCGATLVSRDSLGLIMREDGTIRSVFSDFRAIEICEYINKYKSGVKPSGPGGVFSYSGGTSAPPQPRPKEQEPRKPQKPKQIRTALYVDLRNEDKRFNEYLPFKISVHPVVHKKALSGKKAYVGEFDPGTYPMTIEPIPPDGETTGPLFYTDNPKLRRDVTLSGSDQYLSIPITRKESIEYNIMMTFRVEDSSEKDTGRPLHELHDYAENSLVQAHIERYATEFGLDIDWVNAICYIETSHGWYDGILPIIGMEVKSIRPMNVNIDFWQKLFAARKVTRADLEKKDINVREGCFLLHRLFVRSEPKTLLAVASLYNSHSAMYLSKYGYYVKRAYDQGLWLIEESDLQTGEHDLQTEGPD
jgi:hypothetical protein